jgi:hypothetical protein
MNMMGIRAARSAGTAFKNFNSATEPLALVFQCANNLIHLHKSAYSTGSVALCKKRLADPSSFQIAFSRKYLLDAQPVLHGCQ